MNAGLLVLVNGAVNFAGVQADLCIVDVVEQRRPTGLGLGGFQSVRHLGGGSSARECNDHRELASPVYTIQPQRKCNIPR